MKKLAIVPIILMLVLTGCSTVNKSVESAPFSVNPVTASLEAEVKVGEKISGTSQGSYLFGLFKLNGPNKFADNAGVGGFTTSGLLKAAAAYNAMESSGAEILVNPQYVVEANKGLFVHSYNVTVTGYKGTITEIK